MARSTAAPQERSLRPFALVQAFDRIFRNEGVTGSNPVSSTKQPSQGDFWASATRWIHVPIVSRSTDGPQDYAGDPLIFCEVLHSSSFFVQGGGSGRSGGRLEVKPTQSPLFLALFPFATRRRRCRLKVGEVQPFELFWVGKSSEGGDFFVFDLEREDRYWNPL